LLVAGVTCLLMGPRLFRPSEPPKQPFPAAFKDWPKPDVALLLTGEQHGYLFPCGCSEPQKGGLERRYNFIQELKARGWPVVALDLGDVAQRHGPRKLPNVQGLIKYRYSMMALKEMGYTAVALGEHETALPTFNALGEYALNNPVPRVLAANAVIKDFADIVGSRLITEGNVRVGVLGLVGPSVVQKIKDRDVTFGDNPKILPAALKDWDSDGKPDLRVLLYQGSLEEAKRCAKAYPQLSVILCLTDGDEPPAKPDTVGNTQIISIGHKGKYVGVLAVYRTGQTANWAAPFDFRYYMATMDPSFVTPKEKEKDHPILALLEKYAQELKDDANPYLGRYPQITHAFQAGLKPEQMPVYVGSETCKDCHAAAYKVWEESPHAHAYDTLINARKPAHRQFDGECIVCHTVGFGYKSGFTNATDTPYLKDVGCESCHGPASEHVANPRNLAWRQKLNPWKAKPDETPEQKTQRLHAIEESCVKCHDSENDVTWTPGAFAKKWAPIAHPTPRKKN
jgi:hypothetical protein